MINPEPHVCLNQDGQPIRDYDKWINGDFPLVEPRAVTCGNCGQSWCERCDPAPLALCHWCHGRGQSTAPLGLTLEGMTYDRWMRLPESERDRLRDLSDLTPQLIGLEGWRVEVVKTYSPEEIETRRFIVGRSTGWRPIHLEIARRDSSGGGGADRQYDSVLVLYNVRGSHPGYAGMRRKPKPSTQTEHQPTHQLGDPT